VKGKVRMATRSPGHVRFAVPALVALIVVACGRSAIEPDEAALAVSDDAGVDMEDSGLGTKPLDGGVGTKDAGEGTKDAGLPTKDSGLETRDSGPAGDDDSGSAGDDSGVGNDAAAGSSDAGTAPGDAGTGPSDAGMTGSPDAGPADSCFACAEQRCAAQTNLCLSSPACVTEGNCDLACLSAGKNPLASSRCISSCTKNLQANLELISAVGCGLTLCPKECFPVLAPLQ
jgi:hypothetical protein